MKRAEFVEQCERRLDIRLYCYRDSSVERSIKRMLNQFDCRRLDELLDALEGDARRRQEFIDCLAINVTEFFRDPKPFRYLRYSVLPTLLKRRRAPRLWSAGCATGQEAYSLAMLLEEIDPECNGRIVATDIDHDALTKARRGVFDPCDMKRVSVVRRRKFFDRRDGCYWIRPAVSRRVRFRRHDLLTDRMPRDYYDLIAFRNVAIHFDRGVDRALHRRFVEALRNGGVLFLGGTERLLAPERVGLKRISGCCYAKAEDARPIESRRRLAG